LLIPLALLGQEKGTIIFEGTITITGNLIGRALTEAQEDPVPLNNPPVASFTVDTSSGDAPLTVAFTDTSTDSDGTISGWLWSFGDGEGTSTSQNPSHEYTTPGNFSVTLTATDNDGATDVSNTQVINVLAPANPLPEYEITTLETNHLSVYLSWTDVEAWDDPWIIQRSETPSFTDPTDLTDNQSTSTFRFLGVNADNYVDIEDLSEGTTYYYRVGVVTNLSEHYQDAAIPTFSGWLYGAATTTTLAGGLKLTYDITDGAYGAIAGDGLNDYPAVLAALAAAQAAGGGIIYAPAGTYDLWPVDADVDIVDGYPEIESGETATSFLFDITSDNITFLGDASGGSPTTFWNLYLWGKEPATKWLNVLTGASGSAVSNVRRYTVFRPNAVENLTFKNLDIDMGANPVNTGKEWYSLDEKRNQWDISHKLFSSYGTYTFRNVVFDTVNITNCRGEMIYCGTDGEKILIKNCELRQANSSAISMSADVEIVDTIISDSANGALESAVFDHYISGFSGRLFMQNHIMRGCTIYGLDQTADGVMKNLPGLRNFAGWQCFNEPGTYQSVTDTVFRDCLKPAFGPWYDYHNGFLFNADFTPLNAADTQQVLYIWTTPQALYGLAGGTTEILWLGLTINIERNLASNQSVIYTVSGAAAAGNESPWTIEAVHFAGSGTIRSLWTDTSSQTTGRQNFIWKDWTKDAGVSFHPLYIEQLNGGIPPTFINFFE